jgi:hypothetical protein
MVKPREVKLIPHSLMMYIIMKLLLYVSPRQNRASRKEAKLLVNAVATPAAKAIALLTT